MDNSHGDVDVATDPTSRAPGDNATGGAARLLEVAARNADQLMGEAQAEADRVTAAAKAEAEQVTSAAKADAERVTSAAQAEADRLVGEARMEAERIRAETEKSRNDATQQIAGLRQTEREHRERMQTHLQEMLAKVEANSIG